jgi:hypothetical protein
VRVIALEAGPFFDPAEHTPDEIDAAEINWMDERLSGGADPTAFGPNNSGRGRRIDAALGRVHRDPRRATAAAHGDGPRARLAVRFGRAPPFSSAPKRTSV